MIELNYGIWKSDYVTELSIKDHIHELQVIDEEIKRVKNQDGSPLRVKSLEDHYDKECADLFLLLARKLEVGLDSISECPELVEQRSLKFRQKSFG